MAAIEYSHIEQDGNDSVRFLLEKKGSAPLVFFGLNPGAANQNNSDRTIKKLLGFLTFFAENQKVAAPNNDFDGFIAINMYARRFDLDDSLDKKLHQKNLSKIKEIAARLKNPAVLLAFGNGFDSRPYLKDCFLDIISALSPCAPRFFCVGKTKSGAPRQITRVSFRPLEPFDVDSFLGVLNEQAQTQSENEIEDEFLLDFEENESDDDFSFAADDEESPASENKTETDAEHSEPSAKNMSVDDFYDSLVEPFVRSRAQDFKMFILQGNIPAERFYRAVSLPVFEEPSAEDSERISALTDFWSLEAQKFERTDLQKYNDIKDAAGTIRSFFTTPKLNKMLVESLRAVAWSHLATLVAEKCDDGCVDLKEQVSLKQSANKLGLYNGSSTAEVQNRIFEEIKKNGAKIETLESEFKTFFDEYVEEDESNALDTLENRVVLAKRYKKLKMRSDFVNGTGLNWSDKQYLENLSDFLKSIDISLVLPQTFFAKDYFDSYARNKDVSQLTEAEFAELRSTATGKYYQLSDEQWEEFAATSKIAMKESKNLDEELSKAKESYELQLSKAKKQAEQEKKRAEKAKEQAKHARKNGIIRSFFVVVAIIAAVFGAFALFKKVRPVQYASVVDSVTTLVAPTEEQKEQARLQKEQARLALEAAKPHSFSVGKGEGFDFATIKSALESANDGDTIVLSSGVWSEDIIVSKAVKITGGEDAERTIKSGYFSTKDVPVIAVPDNSSLKISSAATISGLIVSGRTVKQFDSFQKYQESIKIPESMKTFSEDPMEKKFNSIVRVNSDAVFQNVIFDSASQNCVTVTAGNVQFSSCAFLRAPDCALYALASSSVSCETCLFLGDCVAVKTADSAVLTASDSQIVGVWYALQAHGKSSASFLNASVSDYRIAAFQFLDSSEGTISQGVVNTSLSSGNRTAVWTSDSSCPIVEGLSVLNAVFGLWAENASEPIVSRCEFDATGSGDSKTGIVFTDNAKGSIDSCKVLSYTDGIRIQKSASPSISKTQIEGSDGSYGVLCIGSSKGAFSGEVFGFKRGIYLQESAVAEIFDSKIHDCEQAGLTYTNESGGEVKNCEIFAIKSTGVSINDKSSPVLTNVFVHDSKTGFLSSEENTAKLIDCEASNNERGFSVFWDGGKKNAPKNEISGGSFRENEVNGITSYGLSEITISKATVSGNKNGIVSFESSVIHAKNCTVEKNKNVGGAASDSSSFNSTDCSFSKNDDTGFFVTADASATLENCTINKNLNVGVSSSENGSLTLQKCKIKSNKDKNLVLNSEKEAKITELKTNLWTKFLMWWNE